MIKSVNIDGESYVIRSCEECPFYAEALGENHCNYPTDPREFKWVRYEQEMDDNCPLGLVKDCCTCKYEGRDPYGDEPCINCGVTVNTVTGEETPPDKWEVKE